MLYERFFLSLQKILFALHGARTVLHKIENYEETIRSLENDKKELLAHKAKLEASLEDALLGSVETSN